jgi:hypothetical protein
MQKVIRLTEPTKACVRVLKIENMVLRVFKFIIWTIPYKILKRFEKLFEWVFKFINWCIVRAITRWVGPPVYIWLFYNFVTRLSLAPVVIISPLEFVGYMVGIVFVGAFSLISWVEIPYKEREIIFDI